MIIEDIIQLDHQSFIRPTFPAENKNYDISELITRLKVEDIHTNFEESYRLILVNEDFKAIPLSKKIEEENYELISYSIINETIVTEYTSHHYPKYIPIISEIELINFKPDGSEALVRPKGIEARIKVKGNSKYKEKIFQVYLDIREVLLSCNLS